MKNTLTDVPIIVCNLDDGFRSQGLIRDLYDTPEVAIKFVQTVPMDFEQTIVHEKVSGIVVIPKDYSKNVLSGKASRAVQSVFGAGAGRAEFVFANALQLDRRLHRFFLGGTDCAQRTNRNSLHGGSVVFAGKKYRRRELAESPFLAAK